MPDGVRVGPAVTGERLAACSITPENISTNDTEVWKKPEEGHFELNTKRSGVLIYVHWIFLYL